MDPEKLRSLIEIWKQTVEVQQHFNDLGLRIRNLALTLLLAVFGASALALREKIQIVVWGSTLSLASALLVVGAVGWLAFYFIDRFWYHKLLIGAVVHGEALEKIWAPELLGTNIGLTKAITIESRKTSFAAKWLSSFACGCVLWGVGIARFGPGGPAQQVFIFIGLLLITWLISRFAWPEGLEVKARFKLDLFYFGGLIILIIFAILANGEVLILSPGSEIE